MAGLRAELVRNRPIASTLASREGMSLEGEGHGTETHPGGRICRHHQRVGVCSKHGHWIIDRNVIWRLIRDFQRNPDRHRNRSIVIPRIGAAWCRPGESSARSDRHGRANTRSRHHDDAGNGKPSKPPDPIGNSGCSKPDQSECGIAAECTQHRRLACRLTTGCIAERPALRNRLCRKWRDNGHQRLGRRRTADRFVRQLRLLTHDQRTNKEAPVFRPALFFSNDR